MMTIATMVLTNNFTYASLPQPEKAFVTLLIEPGSLGVSSGLHSEELLEGRETASLAETAVTTRETPFHRRLLGFKRHLSSGAVTCPFEAIGKN